MIVIGDVHGEYHTLLELIKILPQTKDICFVGDLIDRGKNSKEVIKFVRENNYNCVMGNHEDMATCDTEYIKETWMLNGGWNTIQSYGGLQEFYDHEDFLWMQELPLFIEYKDFLISHSFATDGDETSVDDVLWGRSFMRDNCKPINIFGHTPMEEVKIINNKHYCIDTGCTYGNKLSAIDLRTKKVYSVDKIKEK